MNTEISFAIKGETFTSTKDISVRFSSLSSKEDLPLSLRVKTSQLDTILGTFTRPNEVIVHIGNWMRDLIVTTVGVYPNLSFKSNGVLLDDLEDHIRYNLFWRPGRSLFINGQFVYKGIGVNTVEATEVVAKVPFARCRSKEYQ